MAAFGQGHRCLVVAVQNWGKPNIQPQYLMSVDRSEFPLDGPKVAVSANNKRTFRQVLDAFVAAGETGPFVRVAVRAGREDIDPMQSSVGDDSNMCRGWCEPVRHARIRARQRLLDDAARLPGEQLKL